MHDSKDCAKEGHTNCLKNPENQWQHQRFQTLLRLLQTHTEMFITGLQLYQLDTMSVFNDTVQAILPGLTV